MISNLNFYFFNSKLLTAAGNLMCPLRENGNFAIIKVGLRPFAIVYNGCFL
jgi:hypothetical protein